MHRLHIHHIPHPAQLTNMVAIRGHNLRHRSAFVALVLLTLSKILEARCLLDELLYLVLDRHNPVSAVFVGAVSGELVLYCSQNLERMSWSMWAGDDSRAVLWSCEYPSMLWPCSYLCQGMH